MKNYPDEFNEEIAIERWENEGGEVKPLTEMQANDRRILICVACLIVLQSSRAGNEGIQKYEV